MASNNNVLGERRAPTHYDRWVIANSKELAPYLANLFLRKFGHKMREFALLLDQKPAEPQEHWKAQCLRCDKTIHIIREKIEIKRSWEDAGGLSILIVPKYKINYGRLYTPKTARESLHASFSLMDPIPNEISTLKEYPLAYTKLVDGKFGDDTPTTGMDHVKWIEHGLNIPIDSFETCEMDGAVNDEFYCSRLRVLI